VVLPTCGLLVAVIPLIRAADLIIDDIKLRHECFGPVRPRTPDRLFGTDMSTDREIEIRSTARPIGKGS
jgi:hypothetical protein